MINASCCTRDMTLSSGASLPSPEARRPRWLPGQCRRHGATGRDELIPLASNSLRSKGIQEDVVDDVSVDERCGHEHGRGSAANMQADIFNAGSPNHPAGSTR